VPTERLPGIQRLLEIHALAYAPFTECRNRQRFSRYIGDKRNGVETSRGETAAAHTNTVAHDNVRKPKLSRIDRQFNVAALRQYLLNSTNGLYDSGEHFLRGGLLEAEAT
jgi:hypothetical protein